MTRDTGRRSVYMAEDAAFEGTPLVTAPGTEVLAAALAALFESPWWRAHDIPVPAVTFRPARNDGFVRRPAAYRSDGRTSGPPSATLLSLGSEATWHVASHEIAHLATRSDDKAHGPAFRGGHVVVTAAVFGQDCAAALRRSYEQFGLDIAPPPTAASVPAYPVWEPIIAWEPFVGGWRHRRSQRS